MINKQNETAETKEEGPYSPKYCRGGIIKSHPRKTKIANLQLAVGIG